MENINIKTYLMNFINFGKLKKSFKKTNSSQFSEFVESYSVFQIPIPDSNIVVLRTQVSFYVYERLN